MLMKICVYRFCNGKRHSSQHTQLCALCSVQCYGMPCRKGRNHWCIYRKCCNIIRHLHRFPFTFPVVFCVQKSQQEYPQFRSHSTKTPKQKLTKLRRTVCAVCVCVCGARYDRWSFIRIKSTQECNERAFVRGMSLMWELPSETINLHSQKYIQKQENCQLFFLQHFQQSRCSEAVRNMKWK